MILGIDSNSDSDTLVAFRYRERHVYPEILNSSHTLILAQGNLATWTEVVRLLENNKITFITASGHGDADTFTGQDRQPIFRVGVYNPNIFSGMIIHLLSCDCATNLGPDMVNNGCKAFFGYDEEIIMDDYGLDCDSTIDYGIINNLNAEEVTKLTNARYRYYMNYLRRIGKERVLERLRHNMNALKSPANSNQWGMNGSSIM